MNSSSTSRHRQSFIGRVQEQRLFRFALEGLLAHHRQWLAQVGQSAPPWTEETGPRDDTYPRIFLVQGAGGIGKSWLTRRCLDIAAGAETSPPVLTLYDDLSLESAVLTPADLLNRLYRRLVEAGQSGAAHVFRQTQTRLSDLSERVARFRADHPALWQSLQEQAGTSQPSQSAADLLLAHMAQAGLLSAEELEDLQNPHQAQARGMVTALQTIIARQPLVIALDNLESVVPLEPFLRDHLVLPTVHLPLVWILSGRSNLADERTVQIEGQTYTHKGYRDFLAQNPPLVWDMSTFGDAELRTYLEAETRRRGVNLTIDDTLVEALKTASAGIPLVVEMVTDALFFMDRDQFVQTFGPEEKSLSPAARLEQVAAHYLRHGLTRDDDLERLYALALLRRHAEPDALAAVWALEDGQTPEEILQTLEERYAFVRRDGLHDAIYGFLRRRLLNQTDTQALREKIASRAAAFYRARWQAPDRYDGDPARLVSEPAWQETTRNLLNALLWQSADEAMHFCLPRLVEGLAFDPAWAADLLHQVDDFLAHAAQASLQEMYTNLLPLLREGLRQASRPGEPPAPETARMLEALLDLPVWEDLHRCILHLQQGHYFIGQNQNQAALAALQAAEETLPPTAGSLRGQSGQLFYHLSRRFLWPNESLEPVPSEEGLLAARRAVALTPQNPAAWHALGVALEYLDRPGEAVSAYRQAVELAPSAVYYTSLGDVYTALNDHEAAIQAYRQALALDDQHAWAYHGLGVVFSEREAYPSAESAFKKAIEYHQNDTDRAASWDGLGDVLAATGRFEEAIDAYRQAVQFSPDEALVWYSLGNMYAALERYEEAIAPFRHAIELDPDYGWAYQTLGLVYERLGDTARALAYYRQAVERHSDDEARAVGWNSLGDVYTARERFDEAIEAYRQAVELDARRTTAWLGLGLALEKTGQFQEASRAFRQVVRLTPDDAEAWFHLGNTASQLNQTQEAVDAYRQVIRLDPANAWAHNNLGFLLYRTGQHHQAEEEFLHAIEHHQTPEGRAVSWDNLGSTYRGLRQEEEAVSAYNQAIRLWPDYPWPYHNLATLYAGRQEVEKAISLFEQAIDRHTTPADQAVSWRSLAEAYTAANRLEEAVSAYRQAIRLTPNNARLWFGLGSAYRDLSAQSSSDDAASRAIEAYRRAIELDPSLAWAYHHLGQIYSQQGRHDEALRNLLEAIDRHKTDAGKAASWTALGDVYRGQQRQSPAIEAYQKALRLNPANAEAAYRLGLILAWERREYERAVPLFQQAARHFSDPHQQARAWNHLGDAYRMLSRYKEAIDAYHQAVELDPTNALPWNSVGDVCRLLGQPEEAIDAYRRAIELDPDFAWPYHSLGLIYSERGEEDRAACESAITLYRQAIERHTSDRDRARAWNNLGSTYQALGRFEEAIKAYRQAIELDAGYALPWQNLGRVYQALSYPEDAVNAYQEALRLNPADAAAWNSLGDVYRSQRRFEEAVDAYKKAIRYDPGFARPYFNLGQIYESRQEYEPAIAVFKQAITRYRSAAEQAVVWTHLGDIYFRLDRRGDAEQAYRQAIEADDEYAWAYHSLGRLNAAAENYEAAIGWFRQALDRHTHDRGRAESGRELGDALSALNRHEEAIEAYRQVLELDPEDAVTWNSLGTAHTALEHYELAIRAFEQAIELDPEYAWPYHNLGYVYEKRGEFEAALPCYQQAIERHSRDEDRAVSWNNLGNVYRGLNRLEEAEAAYRQAVALKPDYALPWDSLGDVYQQLNRGEEAIQAYQQAIRLAPSYPWAYHNLAQIYAARRTYDSALALYEQAIERHTADPDRAITWNNLGKVYYALGRPQDAINAYSRAIELDPTYAWAYNNLGVVYAGLGNLETAANLYRQAIECHEEDEGRAVSWNNLGNVHLSQGRLQEAVRAYQTAIQLNPRHTLSWIALGGVYLKQGQVSEALQAFQEAIQLDGQSAAAWRGLGDAHQAQAHLAADDQAAVRSRQQAAEAYRQAIALDGQHPWPYHQMALIYEAEGNLDQALTSYQQALERYEDKKQQAEVWFAVGQIYRQLGKARPAVDAFRKAAALDETDARPWHSLGVVFMELSRYEDAVKAYRKAIELNPDNGWSYHNLGLVYEAVQDFEAAVSLYEQALERHPNDTDRAASWYRLGTIFHQWGRYDSALTALRRAVALNPNTPAPWIALGDIFRELDRDEETIQAYRKAMELDPLNAQPYNNLGFFYEQKGQYQEAAALYQQVINFCQNPADQAVAWNNLGNVLRAMGKETEAVQAYEKAMALDPHFTWPYHSLGAIYEQQGKYEEALALYQQATRQFAAND